MSRRVVVTGIGLVSSLGIGTEANWAGAAGGHERRRPDHPVRRRPRFATQIAGEVKGFDPLQFVEKKDVKKMDVFIQYAIAASQFAMDDSGLEVTPENAPNVGVFIGSGIGGFTTIEREHEALLEGGPRKISPFFIPSAIINLAAGQVSIRFGAKGPNSATCTACSASAHAIGDAVRDHQARRRRRDDRRRRRGGDHADGRRRVRARCARSRRATTSRQRASRPFDKDRDGFVIGEGAGVLILEELEHARRRGAPIYAEIVGYGMSADAYHMTAPSEDGDGGRARHGRRRSGRPASRPTDVDYINAHGTSTPLQRQARDAGDQAAASATTRTSWPSRRPSR